MVFNVIVCQFNGVLQLEFVQIMVVINKVIMFFGEFIVVCDVDIQVGDGEFFVIVGFIGCGKSIIFNFVVGLLKLLLGQVSIDGCVVSGVQELVGYLFQQDVLLLWKIVYQNVEFGLCFRGVFEVECKVKVNVWLVKVGLVGFEYCYLYQLFGGQCKCVQMVQVLIVELKVILMDELFLVLDIYICYLMQNELLWLWQEDWCLVILIIYDLEEVIVLGDCVVVLFFGLVSCVVCSFDVDLECLCNVVEIKLDDCFIDLYCDIWVCLCGEVEKSYVC